MAVDFYGSEYTINEYIRLRVFINPRNFKPEEKFIECRRDSIGGTKVIHKNLEKYMSIDQCSSYFD